MKRWRSLVWLFVSLACFIGALYFWRLGDKWEAEKSAAPKAADAAGVSSAQANPAPAPHVRMVSSSVKSVSTAPIVEVNPPATNAVVTKSNAFPYRLSNSTQTMRELMRNNRAILLENALIDTTSSQGLTIPDSLKSHGDPGAYIVQARGTMNNVLRAEITGVGATIISYIPNNAYLVTATEGMVAQLNRDFVVQPWEPYFKVKAALMPSALAGQSLAGANVAVFPGAEAETKAALQKMGVSVLSESPSPFGTQYALQNVGDIASVASLPGIEEVEPAYGRVAANDLTRVIMNDSVNVFVPTNYLGLSGSNIWVAVADSWIPTNGATVPNPDLMNIFGDPTVFPVGVGIADTEGHATHVGGIIAGSGLHSPTNAIGSQFGADFRGKAPLATLYAQPALTPFLTDQMLQESAAKTNALISNNSWGYGTSDYNLSAASYDQAVRDSISGATGSQGLIYVFAAGNNGQGGDNGLGGVADTLLSPAVAKNVLSIGASELPRNITNDVSVCDACNTDTNFPSCTTNKPWAQMTDSPDQVARFSARGNVGIGIEGDFGRFKPDLVAPGTMVVSTRSMTWDTNAYYNPTTVDTEEQFGEIVPTNGVFNFSVFVPCDAVRLDISAIAVHPTNVNIPIYVKPDSFPQPPADLAGTNFVSIPNGNLLLTPVDTFWFYSILNPTNRPLTANVLSQVVRTNELGNYFPVLQGLNDSLYSTNRQTNQMPLYRYESGTSMAAPAVAGTLALMEDFFTNRWKYTPSPALMKAMLINGARSINPIYDFQVTASINYQGWGLVNLTNSLPPGITNAFGQAAPMVIVDQDVTNALATGDSRTLFVKVNSNALSAPLRVTLVWTDPPGNPAASVKLVNNLDLIVTNMDNAGSSNPPVVFFGNDFTNGTTFSSQWNGITNTPLPSDSVNNVENVFIPGTLGTNYSITVVARGVNVNALTAHTNGIVQDYALVISCGNGDVTNALTLTDGAPVTVFGPTVMVVTNQFADSTDTSGALLTGQRAGANSPLQGTNTIPLSNQNQWSGNGQITVGVTNQWHFYVITNATDTNDLGPFTNAVFATFLPANLSIPPGGANSSNPGNASRPEPDIDLYVARGLTAFGLTNLDPLVIAGADKSLNQGGTEFIVYSNALPGEVFYIGVKAEDQQAAEYDFLALFSLFPFSQRGPNGEEYLRGLNVPTVIPDGTPNKPGVATTVAIAVQPISVRRVVVTNDIEHQNFGDLFGTLFHNRIPVILNNHTFGNGTTNQQLIYEDNDEGDIPGAQHPDGPGTLQDYIGEEGLGLWLLQETDNTLFNTGRVDHVFIRLDPQADTNGVVATIPPGGSFRDFIDVPPNGTNLTVFIDFLPGSPGPAIQLYLRHGEEPTTALFDYTKTMVAPSDSLTVGRTDLPPLRPGRYFVLLVNNTASPQTVRLRWTIGLDPNGATPTPITGTNSIIGLPDDATTNNTIFITNNQNIVEVNVGVVLKHPRVSDLDLTLVSPEGQRILLFENRGGPSATNMGHLNITTNFFGQQASGNFNADTKILGPVPNSGTLIIDYNFFDIPDTLDVFYDGVDIFSSGPVSNPGGVPGTFVIPYGPGVGNSITIIMNLGGNPDTSTEWEYTPRVVTEDFTYLTFTDDTNVTQMPIKFAVPPYDATFLSTNISFGFELATNGEYFPPSRTNIFDLNGGWVLTTNDVFIRTNYFAGTNLLSMASNQVSVVTDPGTANDGSNYLALARGSIAHDISLTPGKKYTVNYVYRGPGISGWWRGEGNATDSSDPETLGNNGSLIGRFNFPAGEVGQAFDMEDSGLAFQFAGTNTYVQVRQSRSLDVGQGTGFTVEGWINPTNITYQQPLVEWLARVPTNTVVNGQIISTNFAVQAGPFLNRANGHYYYLLAPTNWTTSELWARGLGGHLAEVDDANEQNWIYDTFAQFAGSNYTTWIGLTNSAANLNFLWSTGAGGPVYTNWAFGQPTNCPTAHFTAVLSATNGLPGNWVLLDNNGLSCGGAPTNRPFGVVEVNEIQTNGVQFWISKTNAANPGNGRLYANIFDTNGVPHEMFSPAGIIQSNVFQHVALTYNTNTGVAILYYAGTNVATTNLGVFVPKTGGDVLLGKDMSRATNNFFWGKMDEMSIYSRFLSPSEILAIYQISASTTNRNIGKFDPEITPGQSLGEAQVVFNGTTNLIYGNNRNWQVQGYSLQATSPTIPLQFTGIEPGVLLDSFNVVEHPPQNLYYLPEQPLKALVGSNALGNWTLEIRDARTGLISTNAELESWQLQFILETNIAPPIVIPPQGTGTNTIPPGQIAYFTVAVPSWANFATNIIVSATSPVDLLFNQSSPPGTGAPGDFTLIPNATTGSKQVISAIPPTTPPLVPGQTYYLGVQNNGPVPSTVVVQVSFNLTALTNGLPLTSRLNTNDLERPFVFEVHSNATEATFQLLQVSGNADLVLRKGLPIPNLLSADYGSFSGSNADETIYVLTNSLPVPLSQGFWYMDVIKRNLANNPTASNAVTYAVLAKELTNAPQIINLSNRVPVTFTAGPGAALTNFFKFSTTNLPLLGATNLGIHFEVYNQSGNGDLTVQTNAMPLVPPFLQSSRLPGKNAEIIFIRTNSAMTNLNADWYLGVPNNETNPITFTILAEIDTNNFASFPAAEGAGSSTRGGSLSPSVYHVVTLFDSGGGSLRNGVNSLTNGGTIVFDVAGTIQLSTPLIITNSFLTIAGQTAPSNGVTVAGAPTYIQGAHDIILRYLRLRPTSLDNPLVWSSGFENASPALAQHTLPAGSYIEGWHVDRDDIDLLINAFPVAGTGPYEGTYFIDMNGGNPGQLSTNLATVPGNKYSVSFAYTKNPNAGFATSVALSGNGQLIGVARDNQANNFAALNWHTTSFVFSATSPSTLLAFSSTNTPGASGILLDAVRMNLIPPLEGPDSLRLTNAFNIIVDHVSAGYATNDIVSVLNSTNVTVQWSVLADSLNTTNIASGGSEIRYGAGDVTFHHNFYADNYSGNPTIGENVSLDFVNNVIFNWGIFSGFSTNDLANNPGGLTNFLNYGANYLVAGSNTVFTNVAFWGGTSNTWIFQTNNFIDTNRNSIIDGANTSWGMFSNQYTPFSHAFDIPPPTAPDEAFIAYERVLDFAGTSLFSRDPLDRSVVQRARLRPAVTNAFGILADMATWWPGEGSKNDIIGGQNVTGGVNYTNGKVDQAFFFDGITNYLSAPASSNLNIGVGSGITIEGWIQPDHELAPAIPTGLPIVEWSSATAIGVHLWVQPGLVLFANVKDIAGGDHTFQTAPGVLSTNALRHVALTYDKSSGLALLYVDGSQLATANFGNITPLTTSSIYLGKRIVGGPGGGVVYNGRLDELSIYSRALSPCEIKAIFDAGSLGKQFILSATRTISPASSSPYADVDQDGIPDFWEITLNEFPTNYSPNLDRDGDGYTDLEEYMNWLGVPHAIALHNTQTNIDLYLLSGNTGNLTFGVANGTNGSVVLTNVTACLGVSPHMAIFTPTNDFGNGTNSGFASFSYMVTNTDTMAYFGPVTVSVFVSAVQITNVTLTNIFIFTNPPDIVMDEMTTNTVTNTAFPTNGVTYTLLNPPSWVTIDPTTGIITLLPLEPDGPTNVVITTVATDSNFPPNHATNTFSVTVNEVNRPPVFVSTPPDQTNSALVPITIPNPATDPDIPINPLTYTLLNPPAGMTIDPNTGTITWTPTSAQAPGAYVITTVVTDFNAFALFNNTLSATNTFTIYVVPAIGPFAFTQPAQAVTGTSAKLNGMATPNGFATMAWYEWGTNTLYGNQTTPVNVGAGFNVVYAPATISGLTLNVPYHFRLVVSNIFGGVVTGFDQTLDEAKIVAWGADYVHQIEVPPGLSNIVAIAGAYDHSLALRNNETVVAWGDNTFNQTNVPAGLNNVLAVAGGQYSSMALINGGTVRAWGGNILSVTNVPAGLNNVVMIAGGTYASLALRNNGSIVSWGANFFNLTNLPPGLVNVVEVSGGSYHSLAIRNNGTVVAWGDNSAGQTNVPPNATNVVAIAGGNYHSLALRADGTVVSWGDNSSGQTNVPAGLNNVIAIAAGGFHSLALKSDGTVVGWGDNTAAQALIPAGLTNVVSISSGYFHSLALTPTLLSTNPIIVNITNGIPQTNSVQGGSIVYYKVNVPVNADAATNTLFFTVNGPLNVWYTTNVPPTVGQPNDFHLMTNAFSGTSVVGTATSPQLIAGATYYLGLENTNTFAVSYVVGVDFHIVPIIPLTNGVPVTTSIPSGGITFYQVDVPTNADFASNSLFLATGPLNIWFSTNFPPTITNTDDFLLLTNVPAGTSVLGAGTTPQLIPGSTYYLGVQNTNATAVGYDIGVNFHFVGTGGPQTNTIPISTIIRTNINGTNGFLLIWFAPTNDLFQVQWSPGLPPTWSTFTNIISYHTFISPTNSEFEFFDDGSQTGGSLGFGRIYRLILLGSGGGPTVLNPGTPVTGTTPPGGVTFYQVNTPANANFATNILVSSTGPVNFWFTTNVPPTITNATDFLMLTQSTSGTFTSVLGSVGPPFFVPGTTYYIGVQNTNTVAVTHTVEVDFHLFGTGPSTNPIPISTIVRTNINGTNGFLLVWFAPTNDLFQVQWSPGLPPTWTPFTNIIGFHTFISPTNSEFEFFDDGSQTGGLGLGRYYRLILLGSTSSGPTLLTNGVPVTNGIPSGSVTYYQVNVPTNVDYVTNLLIGGSGPLNVWFSTNNPPTITNGNDSLLLTQVPSGTVPISGSSSPRLVPGGTYYLGIQNTNALAAVYTVEVNFHFVATGPTTNAVPISTITRTNINGTNGFLLVWFAPTNALFQVQWTPGLPPTWSTFSNVISFHTFISPTNSEFEFFDDGSQTGGSLGSGRIYRLIQLGSAPATNPPAGPVPTPGITATNIGGTNEFQLVWFAPTNELFQVQWSSSLPPNWFTFTNIISYSTFISPTNSRFTFIDDGSQSGLGASRYYRLIRYNSGAPSSNIVQLTNGVAVNFTTGAGQTNFFSFDITQTNASVLFELYNLTGNGDLTLQRGSLPTSAPYFTNSANSGTNYEQIVLRTNGTLHDINAISWFLGVPNQTASPINYTIRAVIPTNGILVSGQPIGTTASRPGGSNVVLSWKPTVVGERYEVRTNGSLGSANWGVLTTLVATSTSMTFTDPNSTSTVFYQVVQVP